MNYYNTKVKYLALFKDFKDMDELIIVKSTYVYWYARYVLKGRFELGEDAISRKANDSCHYARYVLNGRFELGEEAIATDSFFSYLYACNVMKGRFELGEAAISKDRCYVQVYNNFLKRQGIDFELH